MSTKVLNGAFLFKRFHGNNIENYTGSNNEPILDMREGNKQLRICDGVTPGGRLIAGEIEPGIYTPVLLQPINNAVDIVASPVLTCSEFIGIKEDLSPDTHESTRWQLSTDINFTTIAHDSGFSTTALTSYDISAVPLRLLNDTTYYRRVKHRGASGLESSWSFYSSFTTRPISLDGDLIATITPPDGQPDDAFGGDVAISADGTMIVVGSYMSDANGVDSGSVYVYAEDANGNWVQQAKLLASDGTADDYFGYSVAISDDCNTIVVGAYKRILTSAIGAAYVFKRTNGVWSQQSKLTPGTGSIGDRFGISVAISADGNTIAVGAYLDDTNGVDAGAAYIYIRSGNSWVQQTKIRGSDTVAGDNFGRNLYLSNNGNTLIISAVHDSDRGSRSGSAYVFTRSGTTWTGQAKLTASDGSANDFLGYCVCLSGDGNRAVISCHNDDDNGVDAGAVYVFARSGTSWSGMVKLKPSDGQAGDFFGRRVSISNDGLTIIAGAWGDDDKGSNAGSAYIFSYVNNAWIQKVKLTPADLVADSGFGYALAISKDGNKAVIGAGQSVTDVGRIGSVYIYN